MPKEGKKVHVIAFGTGPKGRTFLYRLKGMSTKTSFERLKKQSILFTNFPFENLGSLHKLLNPFKSAPALRQNLQIIV